MPQRSHWPEGRMQGFSSTVKWDPSFDLAIRRWENEVIWGKRKKKPISIQRIASKRNDDGDVVEFESYEAVYNYVLPDGRKISIERKNRLFPILSKKT